jgi:hypothetical protein
MHEIITSRMSVEKKMNVHPGFMSGSTASGNFSQKEKCLKMSITLLYYEWSMFEFKEGGFSRETKYERIFFRRGNKIVDFHPLNLRTHENKVSRIY